MNDPIYNNMDRNLLFTNLVGQRMAGLSKGALIQQMEIRRTYTNLNVEPPELANALGFIPVKRLHSEEIITGRKFLSATIPITCRPGLGLQSTRAPRVPEHQQEAGRTCELIWFHAHQKPVGNLNSPRHLKMEGGLLREFYWFVSRFPSRFTESSS